VGGVRHLIVVVPGIAGSVLARPDAVSAWDLRPGTVARDALAPVHLSLTGTDDWWGGRA
jgi:hypothetical protein